MTIGSYNILVIGDIMLDEYKFGESTRQSPEADVPIINLNDIKYNLGGAANVANNLLHLGSSVTLFSIIGDDPNGQIIKQLLVDSNIKHHLTVDQSRRTTTKTRVVDSFYNQFIRLDEEDKFTITKEVESVLINQISNYVDTHKVDAIILQDYNKGMLSEGLIKAIQKLGEKTNIPLIVDPKKDNFELLSNCTILKPNFKEFVEYKNDYQIVKTCESINNSLKNSKLKSNFILVTLAEKGVFYHSQDYAGLIEGEIIQNPDVSGAGDTVISVITILFLMRLNIQQIAYYSNQAGAYVCKKRGISTISKGQLQELLNKTS